MKKYLVPAWLVITQLAYLASIVVWFAVFGIAFMAFDQGVHFMGIMFVTVIGAYPIIIIATSIWAWVSYRRGKNGLAAGITALPLLYALLLLGIGALLAQYTS